MVFMSINPDRLVYPREFRREAVALVRREGRRTSEVARELGVSARSLRRWIVQAEIDAGEREGTSGEEEDELRRLRRENRRLREEQEVLRKAAAFFARESGIR
jgi:transposase